MSIDLMSQVWKRGPERQSDCIVLLTLADRANDKGRSCYPSVPDIADRSRMSESGVRNVLDRLDENGWLDRKKGGGRGKSTHYFLNVDRLRKPPSSSGVSDENPPDESENPPDESENPPDEPDKPPKAIEGEPSGNQYNPQGGTSRARGESSVPDLLADLDYPKDAGPEKVDSQFQRMQAGTVQQWDWIWDESNGWRQPEDLKPHQSAVRVEDYDWAVWRPIESHPAVEKHRDMMGKGPTQKRYTRERIAMTVEDLDVWHEVIDFWLTDDHRKRSVGKQLQFYEEKISEKQNQPEGPKTPDELDESASGLSNNLTT